MPLSQAMWQASLQQVAAARYIAPSAALGPALAASLGQVAADPAAPPAAVSLAALELATEAHRDRALLPVALAAGTRLVEQRRWYDVAAVVKAAGAGCEPGWVLLSACSVAARGGWAEALRRLHAAPPAAPPERPSDGTAAALVIARSTLRAAPHAAARLRAALEAAEPEGAAAAVASAFTAPDWEAALRPFRAAVAARAAFERHLLRGDWAAACGALDAVSNGADGAGVERRACALLALRGGHWAQALHIVVRHPRLREDICRRVVGRGYAVPPTWAVVAADSVAPLATSSRPLGPALAMTVRRALQQLADGGLWQRAVQLVTTASPAALGIAFPSCAALVARASPPDARRRVREDCAARYAAAASTVALRDTWEAALRTLAVGEAPSPASLVAAIAGAPWRRGLGVFRALRGRAVPGAAAAAAAAALRGRQWTTALRLCSAALDAGDDPVSSLRVALQAAATARAWAVALRALSMIRLAGVDTADDTACAVAASSVPEAWRTALRLARPHVGAAVVAPELVAVIASFRGRSVREACAAVDGASPVDVATAVSLLAARRGQWVLALDAIPPGEVSPLHAGCVVRAALRAARRGEQPCLHAVVAVLRRAPVPREAPLRDLLALADLVGAAPLEPLAAVWAGQPDPRSRSVAAALLGSLGNMAGVVRLLRRHCTVRSGTAAGLVVRWAACGGLNTRRLSAVSVTVPPGARTVGAALDAVLGDDAALCPKALRHGKPVARAAAARAGDVLELPLRPHPEGRRARCVAMLRAAGTRLAVVDRACGAAVACPGLRCLSPFPAAWAGLALYGAPTVPRLDVDGTWAAAVVTAGGRRHVLSGPMGRLAATVHQAHPAAEAVEVVRLRVVLRGKSVASVAR